MADPVLATVYDAESLRRRIISGIDAALSRPILSRFLSEEDIRVLKAERDYWQHDDGTQLARLYELFRREV
jgi:hypothetical protein